MPRRRSKRLARDSDNDGDTESLSAANELLESLVLDKNISTNPETVNEQTAVKTTTIETTPKEAPAIDKLPVSLAESVEAKPEASACRSMITVGSISPRNFDGNDDVDDWIEHFIYVSKCNNWDENMQKRRLPVYLKDTAELWFKNYTKMCTDPIGSAVSQSLLDMLEALRKAFRPKNFRSINQSALICRLQGLNEPVSGYYYDVLRLCNKMNPNMCEEDKLTHVMRGLKSGMLEKVLVLEPKDCNDLLNKLRSIEEATFLSNQRPGYNYLLVEENKGKIASVIEAPPKEPEPKVESETDKLCQLMRDLLKANYRSSQPRGPPINMNNRRGGLNRYTRTVDGRPICFNCNTPGHTVYSCPRPRKQRYSGQVEEKPKSGEPDPGNH